MSIESLNSFEKNILSVYGLELTKGFKESGFTGKPIPFLRLRSKLAYEYLMKYATYKSKDWKVKGKIWTSSKRIKKEFLKALFDDEGSVINEHGRGVIKLYSINPKGLRQIQELLLEFDIKSQLSPPVMGQKEMCMPF